MTSIAKQCFNLRTGKKCRLLLIHESPVYNPKVNTIVDNLNSSLTFTPLSTKLVKGNNLKATVRFKITVGAAAPPPGGAPAPTLPDEGELTITLVDVDSGGTETPVPVEPLEVDYIDDPDDP